MQDQAEVTLTLTASDESVAAAADALRRGRLVAFPTETVYGLGADANNEQALARLYEVKHRPTTKPLPVLVGDIETARRLILFDRRIETLCRRFWPGPLTIVGHRHGDCPVSPLASAGGGTLAVRLPDHAVTQALIAAFGDPIAAPSANISGAPTPIKADDLDSEIVAATAIIIDGRPCPLGVASTVVRVDADGVTLLRAGAIDHGRIEAAVGTLMPAREFGQ